MAKFRQFIVRLSRSAVAQSVLSVWGCLWDSPRVGLLILFALFGLAVYWLWHLPAPGKAVLVLALGASIMTLRKELTGWEKTILTLILGLFALIEIRAIDKDRANNQAEQAKFFQDQEQGFSAISQQASMNFRQTTGGLTSAIDGIQSTLRAANSTLAQTQPHAVLRIRALGFSSFPGTAIVPNRSYGFNTKVVNWGTENAIVTKELFQVYTGKPDNLDDQKRLEKQFDREWKTATRIHDPMATDLPRLYTIRHSFTDDDVLEGFSKGAKTVYFLARIQYSDSSGEGTAENCEDFQIKPGRGINIAIFHPCFIWRASPKRQ